jgi:hypothetical protein
LNRAVSEAITAVDNILKNTCKFTVKKNGAGFKRR